jgi:glutamyl-tRNA reductase
MEGIDMMTRAIIKKILHNPSVVIREILEEGGDGESVHLVKRLFGIEDTSSKQSFSSSEEESESIS